MQLSQGTLLEVKKSGTKYLKANESEKKTPEGMQSNTIQKRGKSEADQIHEIESDGTQPDRMQSKANGQKLKVKQPEDSLSITKPQSSPNASDNNVQLPENVDPQESLLYLEDQQISGTANAISDEKLVGNTSTLHVDKCPSNGLSFNICEEFDRRIQNMKDQDILTKLSSIRDEVHSHFKSKKKCWRYEVFSSGNSKEAPGIKRKDLSVNVSFCGFTEDQLQLILNDVSEWFPAVGVDCLITVILPEALIILCKVIFEISYHESEYYLEHGGRCFVEETLKSLENIMQTRARNRPKEQSQQRNQSQILSALKKMSVCLLKKKRQIP